MHTPTSDKQQAPESYLKPVSFSDGAVSALGIYADFVAGGLKSTDSKGFQKSKISLAVDEATGEIIAFKTKKDGSCKRLVDSDTAKRDSRRQRYDLLNTAAKILLPADGYTKYTKTHRTCKCSRVRYSEAQVLKTPENHAFLGGVIQCANPWACAVCGGKISQRKGQELRETYKAAQSKGLQISMLTFTAPHGRGDRLQDLVPAMTTALSSFWRHHQIKNNSIKKGAIGWRHQRGVVGSIRAFEVRLGANGWHPHFHIIIISSQKLEQSDKNRLLPVWQSACVSAGLQSPNQYGLDICDGSQAGEYISKFGADDEVLTTRDGDSVTWDSADEMTKGHSKRGKRGSFAPWDLLRVVAGEKQIIGDYCDYYGYSRSIGVRKAKNQFRVYVNALKGIAQLKYSPGLRKFLDLGEALTNEEAIAIQEQEARLQFFLSGDEWRRLVRNKSIPLLLDLTEIGGRLAAIRHIYDLVRPSLSFESYVLEVLARSGDIREVGGDVVEASRFRQEVVRIDGQLSLNPSLDVQRKRLKASVQLLSEFSANAAVSVKKRQLAINLDQRIERSRMKSPMANLPFCGGEPPP